MAQKSISSLIRNYNYIKRQFIATGIGLATNNKFHERFLHRRHTKQSCRREQNSLPFKMVLASSSILHLRVRGTSKVYTYRFSSFISNVYRFGLWLFFATGLFYNCLLLHWHCTLDLLILAKLDVRLLVFIKLEHLHNWQKAFTVHRLHVKGFRRVFCIWVKWQLWDYLKRRLILAKYMHERILYTYRNVF